MSKLKGEILVGTADRNYTMVFSIDALILLEEAFDKSLEEIGAMLTEGMRPSQLRTVFWAGLQQYHPEGETEGVDLKAASLILSEVGPIAGSQLVVKAFLAAFATGEEAGGKPPTSPRKGRTAGTGPASSRRGAG